MRLFRFITVVSVLLGPSLLMAEVRIQQSEALKFAASRVPPEYTAIAKQMKITGRVDIEVIVTPDGSIESAKALSGNPLLTAPTLTAIKKWKFNPITVDGQAVKAITTLSFDFK
jgi:TonB family protein